MGPIPPIPVPSDVPQGSRKITTQRTQILAGPYEDPRSPGPPDRDGRPNLNLCTELMMTNLSVPKDPNQIREYKGHAVRVLILDGVPCFPPEDIGEALGYYPQPVADALRRLPAHALVPCLEDTEGGLADVELLTPIGVWLLTNFLDPRRNAGVAAWSRRVATELAPSSDPKDPRMFLTVSASGTLPPRPDKYSGRLAEWCVLRDSPEYEEAQRAKIGERAKLQRQLLEESENHRLERQRAARGEA